MDLTPFRSAGFDIQYHLTQIASWWEVKAFIGVLGSLYAQYLVGEWALLVLYLIFYLSDLFLGVLYAFESRTFCLVKLQGWVLKLLTHVFTIFLIGGLNLAAFLASGYRIPILDGVIFVLISCEALSILVKADKLGWPLPDIAKAIVSKVHNKAVRDLNNILDEGDCNDINRQGLEETGGSSPRPGEGD